MISIANPAAAFASGGQYANQLQQIKRQNALADLYRTQGQGIAAGEKNALAALSALDPMAARDINRQNAADAMDRQRFDMQQQQGQMGLQIDRARLAQIHAQTKQAAADHAAKMSAAEALAEQRKIDSFMAGAAAAFRQGPEAFQGFVGTQSQAIQQSGFDPAQMTYQTFPQIAAALVGMREGLDAGIKAGEGFVPQQPKFKTVTGEDAKAMGLDPSKSYNVGADGKVTAIGGGGVTVNSAQVGSIPQGYQLVQDAGPNGQTVSRLEPIPGGPADTSGFDAKARENRETQANIVLDEISIAKDLIKGETELSPATGITGSVVSRIDSTRAGALKNRLSTIKANIGFDKLQAMRDASPTGGALGQVSEFENRLLQAVFGSLEQAQKAEDILYNLDRMEMLYQRIINDGIPDDEARALYREVTSGKFKGEASAATGNNPYEGISVEEFSRIDLSKLTPEQVDQLFEAMNK